MKTRCSDLNDEELVDVAGEHIDRALERGTGAGIDHDLLLASAVLQYRSARREAKAAPPATVPPPKEKR